MEDDDDEVDGAGDSGSSLNANSSRDRKNLADQLNGDKSGKPRKKKTRTVFSRSQVSYFFTKENQQTHKFVF